MVRARIVTQCNGAAGNLLNLKRILPNTKL